MERRRFVRLLACEGSNLERPAVPDEREDAVSWATAPCQIAQVEVRCDDWDDLLNAAMRRLTAMGYTVAPVLCWIAKD